MSNEAIIFTGVGIYLAIMLVIGLYAAKRSHSAADFIVSGRRMPLWICSVTLMATWFGGGTMMGASGAAYEGGLLAVIADPFGGAMVEPSAFSQSPLLLSLVLSNVTLISCSRRRAAFIRGNSTYRQSCTNLF